MRLPDLARTRVEHAAFPVHHVPQRLTETRRIVRQQPLRYVGVRLVHDCKIGVAYQGDAFRV